MGMGGGVKTAPFLQVAPPGNPPPRRDAGEAEASDEVVARGGGGGREGEGEAAIATAALAHFRVSAAAGHAAASLVLGPLLERSHLVGKRETTRPPGYPWDDAPTWDYDVRRTSLSPRSWR